MIVEKLIRLIPVRSDVAKMVLGIILTVVLITIVFSLVVSFLGLAGKDKATLIIVGAVAGAFGGLMFATRFLKSTMLASDERFITHRSHATRWSAIAGIVVMSGWILYDFGAHQLVRWDFITILGVMALSKWIALIIYGVKN
jgi:hypothetical protein